MIPKNIYTLAWHRKLKPYKMYKIDIYILSLNYVMKCIIYERGVLGNVPQH